MTKVDIGTDTRRITQCTGGTSKDRAAALEAALLSILAVTSSSMDSHRIAKAALDKFGS